MRGRYPEEFHGQFMNYTELDQRHARVKRRTVPGPCGLP
jgi:hypothetical protein